MAKATKKAKRKQAKKANGAAQAKQKRARNAPEAQIHLQPSPRARISTQGLRSYAKYRDLGIAPATGGMVQAHVIRMLPPFRPEEVSTPHYHDVEFQMIYVLKGWMKTEFEGEGTHTFHAGSCWIQPPKIKHTVLGYSDDCELLEIVLPADFETVTLA